MPAVWDTPKYDWDEVDGVADTDLNRIEENIQWLYDALAAEIAAREAADTALSGSLGTVSGDLAAHVARIDNPHSVTKTQVGLGNVTNDACLPLAGGTMTGAAVGSIGTDYTTRRFRCVILSTLAPNPADGENGDVWVQYEV